MNKSIKEKDIKKKNSAGKKKKKENYIMEIQISFLLYASLSFILFL